MASRILDRIVLVSYVWAEGTWFAGREVGRKDVSRESFEDRSWEVISLVS
jgi:hypothetical protein